MRFGRQILASPLQPLLNFAEFGEPVNNEGF